MLLADLVLQSFRDPAGSVTVQPDRVLRLLNERGATQLDAFLQSQTLRAFATSIVETRPAGRLAVEHPKVWFPSYPYEWPAEMLHAAGELTLDLAIRLLDEGWGQSWGVFLKIGDASNLRHHLRKLLKVRDEAGRHLIFRFQDPRVLRVYLPTCHVDELRQFFGPVTAFLAESASADALVEYSFDKRVLRQQVLAALLTSATSTPN